MYSSPWCGYNATHVAKSAEARDSVDTSPEEALMGRPRSFEESELLEAVMVAFWRNGYTATTYRSL